MQWRSPELAAVGSAAARAPRRSPWNRFWPDRPLNISQRQVFVNVEEVIYVRVVHSITRAMVEHYSCNGYIG